MTPGSVCTRCHKGRYCCFATKIKRLTQKRVRYYWCSECHYRPPGNKKNLPLRDAPPRKGPNGKK